jgi:2C-methyl-D-erythritol 2,4-cyclodiphosphate synthase
MLDKMHFPKGRDHGEFLKILNERLRLNEWQMAQVDSILDSRRQKMEIYRRQALAMRDTTRAEIRKVLNIEQGKIFDEFNQEKDQQEEKRREHEIQKEK